LLRTTTSLDTTFQTNRHQKIFFRIICKRTTIIQKSALSTEGALFLCKNEKSAFYHKKAISLQRKMRFQIGAFALCHGQYKNIGCRYLRKYNFLKND
jgi:hypothetical protein